MKELSKVVLVALGFVSAMALAVALTSTPQLVKADAHDYDVMQPRDHVVLDCSGSQAVAYQGSTNCLTWTRVFEDGNSAAFTGPESDKVLIITDLEWTDLSGDGIIGNLSFCDLLTPYPNSSPLMYSAVQPDSNKNLFGAAHSGTGIALRYAPRVACNADLGYLPYVNITLRGYMIEKDHQDPWYHFRF